MFYFLLISQLKFSVHFSVLRIRVTYPMHIILHDWITRKLGGTGIKWTLEVLVIYWWYINVLGQDINITKKRTEAVLIVSKKVGLEVNTEKT